MPIVTVGEFAPDQAAYLSTSLQIASNTVPREDGSDAPLNAPGVMTAALPSACAGAIMATDGNGSAALIAGTKTKLYLLTGGTWNDVSNGTYAVPDTDSNVGAEWRFAQFGTRLIATNGVDAPVVYPIGTGGPVTALASGAPKAKYVATVEPGFLMFGNITDSSLNTLPNAVWWSGINDAPQWPAPGTAAASEVQSDYQQLPLGDAVQGIVPAIGGAAAAVFTERSIYRAEYVGSPAIFAFREVDRSRGCFAPYSLVQVGSVAYFLSEEGFCAFDGQQTTLIGYGKVDRFFWNDVNARRPLTIKGVVNPLKRVIIWSYQRPSGEPRWLIYSYASNRWRLGSDPSLAVEAWVQRVAPSADDALVDLAVTTFGFGARLLNGLGGFILAQAGSRILIGASGPATFAAAFNTSHQLVGYAGAPLEATLETGETDADGRRVFVSGIRPLTDAVAVVASVGTRDTFSQGITYTAETAQSVTGICPQRISTRYARARLRIPAGTAWTYLQGAEVRARPEGTR